MIVAIDGPAGSGKSTVAKQVAKNLGFHYMDTGAMYRCIAWLALDGGVDLDDAARIGDLAQKAQIIFGHEAGNPLPSSVSVNGTDVTRAIRTHEVDTAVSRVSAIPAVREALVAMQRTMAATDDVVMEGRDIGTVVFPNAEVKVFLTAAPEERARRRAAQNAARGVGETDPDVILASIRERDRQDSTRETSPLKPAEDAHMLDSTGFTIDEVCAQIAELAKEARA